MSSTQNIPPASVPSSSQSTFTPLSARGTATTYQSLYLTCAAISLMISWAIALKFLLSGEASVALFFAQAFATPVAALVSSDVLLSALIFLIFARIELNRLGMPANRLILYVAATFSVGVCFGLSLFLYQRESWLTRLN
ncbi:MAG: DUF2834 domain-containing protein [Cyanobacteria bacterium J06631_12]